MVTNAKIEQIGIGAMIGLVYGIYGFLTKHEGGESIETKKLARTVVLFAVGGAISVGIHGETSEAAISEQAAALGGTLGLAFDMAWARVKREM